VTRDYAAKNEVFRPRFGEEPSVRTTFAGNSPVEIEVSGYA
jgi:hypothetical protein